MGRNNNRHLVFIGSCAVVGVILGGVSSQVEINQCLTSVNPSEECVTQDPQLKKVEGMSFGFLAGVGSAAAIAWQIWMKENE